MNSIALMIDEHKYIVRMLKVVRKACYGLLQQEDIVYDDFDKMIDFIRNYADIHHHGKEEKFLFKEMINHLGPIGNKLITHGMLVEHDWGRLFISELVNALDRVKAGDEQSKLDVIANAVGYANHLARHIAKEDEIIYTFAAKNLSEDIISQVNQQTEDFEQQSSLQGTQKHYIELLEKLEEKYICE